MQPDFDGSQDGMDKTNPLAQSQTKPIPNSSDILFLKRLLYLKASIDNEATLNAFSVPLEQENRRDSAPHEQLMIHPDDILSKKGQHVESQNESMTHDPNSRVDEQGVL